MKHIYVVTDGCYSDYQVQAVFEREDDARAAIREGLRGEIEEFPYFAAGEKPRRFTIYRAIGFAGEMDVEVDSYDYSEGEWCVFSEKGAAPPRRPQVRVIPRPATLKARGDTITAICGDRNAAIKAVKDRLAAIKAEVRDATAVGGQQP